MDSSLGGAKIEGVVIKNYHRFSHIDGKALMGKYVSEAFKEVHRKEWARPTRADFMEVLIEQYRTEARWNKAVQHIAERGELQNAPQDIGVLIREVQQDVFSEEEAAIKEQLWAWAKPMIQRGAIKGLPEWWKQKLLERQDAIQESTGQTETMVDLVREEQAGTTDKEETILGGTT